MKLTSISLAAAAVCVFAHSAQAHGYHHHRYGYRHHASRQILSQRYLERSGYSSEEGQSWGDRWQQWPSDSADQWHRSARAGWSEYSGEYHGHANAGLAERRRILRRRHRSRYAERPEGRYEVSYQAARTDYHGGYGPRPAAWCGWEMRHLVGADPGPQYNLARNWAHWGHAGPAGVGAVVVWPHHVGKIVGRDSNGQWVIESGNDGHRLRTRPRSISGAIAIRWG
jgi:hypothetical protein